jgi:hypothetical protein
MGKTTAIRANKKEEKTRTNWKIHTKAAKARAIWSAIGRVPTVGSGDFGQKIAEVDLF